MVKPTSKLATALLLGLLAFAACKKAEKHSALVPEAQSLARKAAQKVLDTPRDDTLALQKALFDARSRASKFNAVNDYEAVDSFDCEFKRYLREKSPELSKEIFPNDETENRD